MSKWIKTTTPPDSEREVLIYPGRYRKVSIGTYRTNADGDQGYWQDETEQLGDEGTGSLVYPAYWMPLPTAPKLPKDYIVIGPPLKSTP